MYTDSIIYVYSGICFVKSRMINKRVNVSDKRDLIIAKQLNCRIVIFAYEQESHKIYLFDGTKMRPSRINPCRLQ